MDEIRHIKQTIGCLFSAVHLTWYFGVQVPQHLPSTKINSHLSSLSAHIQFGQIIPKSDYRCNAGNSLPNPILKSRGRGGRRPGRAPFTPTLPIPGYAGFRYDTQHLSPFSAERAAEVIQAGFILHSLKSMTDGRDRYIAFQLHVPVAIRIYDPVIQQLQSIRATCNCMDYQSTQTACAHLYVSQYLVYTVFALTCIVALYMLECCVKRRSARKPA